MDKQTLFLSLYNMILADGVVKIQELEHLYKIGTEKLGISQQEIDKYILSTGSVVPHLNTLDEKITHLYLLAEMVWADNEVDDAERNLLRRYVINYDFEEDNADAIVDFILDRVHRNIPMQDVINEAKNMED